MPMQAYYISLLILLEKDILSDFSLKMSLGYFYFFLVIHLFNIEQHFTITIIISKEGTVEDTRKRCGVSFVHK